MKTAISLPDELFHAAERLARESRRSRSQLYADALADYVRRHADSVTTAMNRVVDQLGDRGADPAFAGAALQTLMRSEWQRSRAATSGGRIFRLDVVLGR